MRGVLADVGVLNLLHVVQTSRKTGQLSLQQGKRNARLFFIDGNLVHAAMGDREGLPVVDEVAHWETGEYEFEAGVQQDRSTVLWDLEAAMGADEDEETQPVAPAAVPDDPPAGAAAFKARLDKVAATAPKSGADPKLSAILTDFANSTQFILGAWLINRAGAILAAANTTAVPAQQASDLKNLYCCMMEEYPRRPIRRLMIEDTEGHVIFQGVDRMTTLVVIAGKGASPGVISMAAGKLSQNLAGRKTR